MQPPRADSEAAAPVTPAAGVLRPSMRLVVCLGLSQLAGWGTMHYLIALFAAPIGSELGWSAAFVQAGFSLSLVTMGAVSFRVGRWIDRHGGRAAMMTGCWCGAAGCALLAATHHAVQFLAAWVLLGLGMRLALYDAAFATLAHVAGPAAKRAMSAITLFGGLASTVFWPLGGALGALLGWRGALGCYALLLVLTSALHLAIPRGRRGGAAHDAALAKPAPPVREVPGARVLYGVIVCGVLFLQTGMAAHLIGLLRGRGWSAAEAVGVAALFGVGQFAGRSWVLWWAHRVDAVRLNLLPSTLQCLCFVAYLFVGGVFWGAAAFALLYGLGNGIATIARGAMPLVLFDPARYGRIVGAVLKPAFALAAAAPVAFAVVIEHWGAKAAVSVALALGVAILAAGALLQRRVARERARERASSGPLTDR